MKKNSTSLAEILLKEIFRSGVEYVFLVPGAQIVPLVQVLFENSIAEIPIPIIANHELAAGFMAMGYSRASGKAGIVLSIGGPGAAYMVGAGICAKADDVPLILITGNIPPDNYGKGEFQDASQLGTNDVAIYRETVGNSVECKHPDDFILVVKALHDAIYYLKPLHIQIPINVLKEEIEPLDKAEPIKPKMNGRFTAGKLPDRTVLLLGRKVSGFINPSVLSEFVHNNSIPVVTDMKTRGVLPETEPQSIGYIGFNSDIRALEVFSGGSALVTEKVVAIGVKPELINQYIDTAKIQVMSIEPGLTNEFLSKTTSGESEIAHRKEWISQINKIKLPISVIRKYKDRISYFDLLETINRQAPENVIYCLDSGQIRRAGSLFLTCKSPQMLIQSDTLSPMGSGICASIGAQVANPDKRVIALFGDGSMRMHGMELSTAVRYNLPVVFILCDNRSYASTMKLHPDAKDLPYIDWKAFADSIGINLIFADNEKDFSEVLSNSFAEKKPALIWLKVPYLLEDEIQKIDKLEYKNWLSGI